MIDCLGHAFSPHFEKQGDSTREEHLGRGIVTCKAGWGLGHVGCSANQMSSRLIAGYCVTRGQKLALRTI